MSDVPRPLGWADHRPALLSLAIPLAIISLLAIVLMPIPVWLMDFLICANLAISLLVLLTVLAVDRPAELTLFPTLLLGLTLFRVALNVATTRLILTGADRATDGDPSQIAGHAIAAFGYLVASGDLVTGAVIFGILTVVQFVVITRGASRIGEVAARFALDALPGRQLAIDADLRSGTITPAVARERRDQLSKDADFFAGLDGVGKFLRGDAIAGLLIVAINALGGLYVGLVRLGWPIDATLDTFTVLTIGDGLATQLPALLCSVSAGLLVTRGNGATQFVPALRAQFLRRPAVLTMAAALVALLAFTPLPKPPLLVLTVALLVLAWRFHRAAQRRAASQAGLTPPAEVGEARPAAGVPALEVRLGPDLRPLAARVIGQVPAVRQAVADALGLPLPAVTVRDERDLPPTGYQVLLRGEPVADGTVFPGCRLVSVVSGWSGAVSDPLTSAPARWEQADAAAPAAPSDRFPLFDLPAAQGGFEPAEVILRHLHRVVLDHGDELLTREAMSDLLDRVTRAHPRLMDEAAARNLGPGLLQRICQQLLREDVPIRDLPAIIEAASEGGPDAVSDWTARLASVRQALRRTLVRPCVDDDQVLRVLAGRPGLASADPGELALAVRRQWPGFPLNRPVLWLEATERLAVWQNLYQAGLRCVCLCPGECPPGQRVVVVGQLDLADAASPAARPEPLTTPAGV